MPNYDFKSLSSLDFEVLVRDLLQAEFGLRLESFKTGRDHGIDLRYATEVNRTELVIQCKHYADAGFAKLLSHLRKAERPKIDRLAARRYLLATSVGLSPQNKDEVADACGPSCRGTQDVLGRDDLNALLAKFPTVERGHFKLWLSSSDVRSLFRAT